MGEIVGFIISKTTQRRYVVRWKKEDCTSWISNDKEYWQLVCTDVRREEDAISCAQRYIDSQPDLF